LLDRGKLLKKKKGKRGMREGDSGWLRARSGGNRDLKLRDYAARTPTLVFSYQQKERDKSERSLYGERKDPRRRNLHLLG